MVGLLFSIVSALLAPILTTVAAALWRRRHRWRHSDSPAVLAEAADAFADAEWDLWRAEAAERRGMTFWRTPTSVESCAWSVRSTSSGMPACRIG